MSNLAAEHPQTTVTSDGPGNGGNYVQDTFRFSAVILSYWGESSWFNEAIQWVL